MLRGQVNNWGKKSCAFICAAFPPPHSPPQRLKLCSDSRSFWTENLTSRAKTNPRLSGPQSPKYLFAPACSERNGSDNHWRKKWAKVSRAHTISIWRKRNWSLLHCAREGCCEVFLRPLVPRRVCKMNGCLKSDLCLFRVCSTLVCECLRVEVRRPSALLSAHEGGNKLHHHVGNVCAFWHAAEREKSVHECLFPHLFSFPLLISMQTPESLHCGRHGYAEWLIHRPKWRRGISIDEKMVLKGEPCSEEAYFVKHHWVMLEFKVLMLKQKVA